MSGSRIFIVPHSDTGEGVCSAAITFYQRVYHVYSISASVQQPCAVHVILTHGEVQRHGNLTRLPPELRENRRALYFLI